MEQKKYNIRDYKMYFLCYAKETIDRKENNSERDL